VRIIFEAFIYPIAWLYFHLKLFLEAMVKFVRFTVATKVKFDIHTFIGAGLAVVYYYVFTGEIGNFHGFHDALPQVIDYAPAARGTGAVFGMAIVSVLLITLARGFFVFIGYTLIFWVYIVLVSFETPKHSEPKAKEHISSVLVAPKDTVGSVMPNVDNIT